MADLKLKKVIFGELVLKWIAENDWEIYEDFEVIAFNKVHTIPKGTKTDLASIPKIFHSFIKPSGPYAKAAVWHDDCYRNGRYTRRISDAMFLRAMKDEGVNWRLRHIIH